MPFAPNEEELLAALVELRRANPTLGVAKLHALLLASHEDWIVSLKRTTKVLKEAGLTLQSSLQAPSPGTNNPSGSDRQLWPSSQVMASLDVTKYSSKVEVKYFDKEKGKGLVAKDEIKEGEVIWKEDPWIVAPEWYTFMFIRRAVPHSHNSCILGKSTISKSPGKLVHSAQRS